MNFTLFDLLPYNITLLTIPPTKDIASKVILPLIRNKWLNENVNMEQLNSRKKDICVFLTNITSSALFSEFNNIKQCNDDKEIKAILMKMLTINSIITETFDIYCLLNAELDLDIREASTILKNCITGLMKEVAPFVSTYNDARIYNDKLLTYAKENSRFDGGSTPYTNEIHKIFREFIVIEKEQVHPLQEIITNADKIPNPIETANTIISVYLKIYKLLKDNIELHFNLRILLMNLSNRKKHMSENLLGKNAVFWN